MNKKTGQNINYERVKNEMNSFKKSNIKIKNGRNIRDLVLKNEEYFFKNREKLHVKLKKKNRQENIQGKK